MVFKDYKISERQLKELTLNGPILSNLIGIIAIEKEQKKIHPTVLSLPIIL